MLLSIMLALCLDILPGRQSLLELVPAFPRLFLARFGLMLP